MAKMYNVLIRLPATKLATVIEVLEDEGEVVSVVTSDESAIKPRRKRRNRVAGMRGVDIVMDLARGGADITVKQIEKLFVEKGLHPVSVSPRIAECVRAGALTKVAAGTFKITPKGKA